VTRDFIAEATATLRHTGGWSVYLGPGGFLERVYVRRSVSPAPELERRLGMLATCLGGLLATTLAGAGISNDEIRAKLQCASHQKDESPSAQLSVEGELLVECGADHNTVQALYERWVRTDPLVLLLTRDIQAMAVRVTVHSSVRIGIG
jgi:hypothetical protein